MALPLPALTFVRMADRSPTSTGIGDMLDAVFNGGSALTDYRGTSVPSTHRWTWTKRQASSITEAVTVTAPASTPMTKAPGIIWAGRAVVNTPAAPTPATPDTMFNSTLFVGVSKNIGSYGSWDAAKPFGAGSDFFGYWRAAPLATNATTTVVRVFVSQETILVQVIQSGGTSQSWQYAGAIVEPYDADTLLSGEADNRLYGQTTSGSAASVSAAWLTSSDVFTHSSTAQAVHTGVFNPNASTIAPFGKLQIYISSAGTAANLQTPSGSYAAELMACALWSGTTPSLSRLGTLRGLYPIGTVQSGRYLRSGATDLYHFVSVSTVAAAQGMMLPAVS
jgi:hypothetical protein